MDLLQALLSARSWVILSIFLVQIGKSVAICTRRKCCTTAGPPLLPVASTLEQCGAASTLRSCQLQGSTKAAPPLPPAIRCPSLLGASATRLGLAGRVSRQTPPAAAPWSPLTSATMVRCSGFDDVNSDDRSPPFSLPSLHGPPRLAHGMSRHLAVTVRNADTIAQ